MKHKLINFDWTFYVLVTCSQPANKFSEFNLIYFKELMQEQPCWLLFFRIAVCEAEV